MSNTTPAAQNVIVGNGAAIHAPSDLLPNHPLCGRVRATGRGQRIRRTDKPVTCKGCLTK